MLHSVIPERAITCVTRPAMSQCDYGRVARAHLTARSAPALTNPCSHSASCESVDVQRAPVATEASLPDDGFRVASRRTATIVLWRQGVWWCASMALSG